jgi:multidrug efflux pump
VNSSQASLGVVVQLMVLVIVTLLMLQLRSFKSAARVLVSAPLGLVGVVASLLLFRQPFGFVAILGVTALAGIIMRNSVILVELIERFIETTKDPRRAIIEAAVRRLRPIVLTAAATILAMVPLTQAVFWRPMAVAMMGGVAVATLLTLVFEPAIYAAWFGVPRSAGMTRKPRRRQPRRDPVEFAKTQFMEE